MARNHTPAAARNPGRPLASGDHGPFDGEHEHAHRAFGDDSPRLHHHYGEGGHARIAAAMAGTVPPRHQRFQNGENRILASAYGAPRPPGADPLTAAARAELAGLRLGAAAARRARDGGAPPPGAALDSEPFARNWGAFLGAISTDEGQQRVGAAIRNAGLSERIPAGGGFLVPDRLASEVLAYMTRAIVRPRAMVVPADTLRVSLPLLDNPDQSGGNQSLGGLQFAMLAEGEAFPVTDPQFGRVTLEASKAGAYLQNVPDELVSDGGQAFSDFLSRIIAMGYEYFEDSLFIVDGTGVNEPLSLLNSPAALPVTRANSGQAPVHADTVACLKALHPASKATASWLVSEDAFDALLDEYLAVGSPTTQAVTPSDALRFDPESGCWRLHGLPALVDDFQAPAGTAGDIMLCDLGLYAIGDRQTLTVERSSAGSAFTAGASNFRFRARLDAKFWPQGPYVLSNGKTTSPLVVLS